MRRVVMAVIVTVLAGSTSAIETDQFYAWGRPLTDSTDVMNAKVNLEIDRVLAEVNRRRAGRHKTCQQVRKRIVDHFRLLIFHDLELWAINTPLVDRIPATAEEELEYRRRYIYHTKRPLDPVRMIPPSPTIKLNGVSLGTDKLTHFLSEGWWYYRHYRNARHRGRSREEAERIAINRGVLSERTILGLSSSGVFSIADLEANYQGLRFLADLCDHQDALLQHTEDGWRLREPFDFRDWVTPEWDESWQPSVFSKRRWAGARLAIWRYCPLLGDPRVRQQREDYVARDEVTPTEARVRELVERGRLPDPRTFSIERVCAEE